MTNRQAINHIYRLFHKYYNDSWEKSCYDLFLFKQSVEQLAKCGDLNDCLIWVFHHYYGLNKQTLFKKLQIELRKEFNDNDCSL